MRFKILHPASKADLTICCLSRCSAVMRFLREPYAELDLLKPHETKVLGSACSEICTEWLVPASRDFGKREGTMPLTLLVVEMPGLLSWAEVVATCNPLQLLHWRLRICSVDIPGLSWVIYHDKSMFPVCIIMTRYHKWISEPKFHKRSSGPRCHG